MGIRGLFILNSGPLSLIEAAYYFGNEEENNEFGSIFNYQK